MKKAINTEVGLRIRRCREQLGYSREVLAERAELATSFLSTIELGTGGFSAENLAKLCRALGVSADYILFGAGERKELSELYAMLSGLNEKYHPQLTILLGAYIKTVLLAERAQNGQEKACSK